MIYFIKFETFVLIAESSTEDITNATFIKVDKLYQVLSIPTEITSMDGKKQLKSVLNLRFDKDDKSTYNEEYNTGNFFLNITKAVDISILHKIPSYEIISSTELKKIQDDLMRQRNQSQQNFNNPNMKY